MAEEQLSDQEILKILKNIRLRLLVDYPYFGFFAMNGDIILVDELSFNSFAATDGKDYFFLRKTVTNQRFRRFLPIIFIHEILHNQLYHMPRGSNRVWILWLMAIDYAINSIINNTLRLSLPEFALYDSKFDGWSAERIYFYLLREIPKSKLSKLIYEDEILKISENWDAYRRLERDYEEIKKRFKLKEHIRICGPLPNPDDVDPQKAREKWMKIKQLILKALKFAKLKGNLPLGLERFVKGLLEPKLDLAAILENFAYKIGKGMGDYSFFYRNIKRESDYLLPGTAQIKRNLVIAVDTSGSIDDETLQMFLSEVSAIKDSGVKFILATVDVKTYGKIEISEYDDFVETIMEKKPIKGGGGTDFREFFDWLQTLEEPVDGVIFFTDGNAYYPEKEKNPPYPVLWIITDVHYLNAPPFGETYYMPKDGKMMLARD